MEEPDYKSYIDHKIVEAKLVVAEKRYQNLWLLFSVVGVIIPIGLAIFSAIDTRNRVSDQIQIMERELVTLKSTIETQKTDYSFLFTQLTHSVEQSLAQNLGSVNTAKASFEQRFKDLTGTVFKGPRIQCLVNGLPIDNQVFRITKSQNTITIGLKNIGDQSAKNLKVTLYANNESNTSIYGGQDNQWEDLERSDEPAYQNSYKIDYYRDEGLNLDPFESNYINLSVEFPNAGQMEVAMMLKIHFGQPKPSEFPFKVILQN